MTHESHRSVIMCYDALNNPQLRIGYENNHQLKVKPESRTCPVSADDAILRAAQPV